MRNKPAKGGSGADADTESVAPPELCSLSAQSYVSLKKRESVCKLCSATAPEVTRQIYPTSLIRKQPKRHVFHSGRYETCRSPAAPQVRRGKPAGCFTRGGVKPAGRVDAAKKREEKRKCLSNTFFPMDAEEADPDVEAHGTRRPHEPVQEPKGFVGEMIQQFGDFLPVGGGGGGGGGIEEEASPSSVLEYSFYLDDRHGTAIGPVSPPDTPVIHRPRPSSLTTIANAINANPAVSSPVTESCSPVCSLCNPTASDRDTLESSGPGCSDRDPVCAAAHLHLLGESLSLIGRHLQQTDKMVCASGSLSLLLDSLLCALAPITCLTAQIPELRSCTQHTLASTLENIAYVMPGL